jgi:hypothetical protein
MRRLGWILLLLMAASPVWAAKKIGVQELRDLLSSLDKAKKTDGEVAAALAQVELTEQLSRGAMNSLSNFIPGPKATEQLYVLEVRASGFAPPAAEVPSTPAPDAAVQKAILEKAADYAAKTYGQLPHLKATKGTFRFQDSGEFLRDDDPDKHAKAVSSGSTAVSDQQIVHFMSSVESAIESENGAEKIPAGKVKAQKGQVDQITLLGQGPVLTSLVREAQAAGKLAWVRWETIDGAQVAVFSFAVDKKNSRYAVNYCCFPANGQSPDAMSYGNYGARAGVASAPGGSIPSGSGTSLVLPATMTAPQSIDWKNYKAALPYHGELFVDPATGVVLRLVTEAEFKPADLVQQEHQRIDYGPVTVGGKTLILPVKARIGTEVIPSGYTGFGRRPIRITLFTVDYKDYAPFDAAPAEQK